MSEWPSGATEDVALQPANDEWRRAGEQLCNSLDALLGPWLVAPTEHVGSTAVPGLAAKPITDIQAAVADLDCANAVAKILLPTGWHLVPVDLDARPWRRFLVQAVNARRVAHLHLLPAHSPRWVAQLAFRDALRANPVLVQRYAVLKRTLAAKHVTDREAYTAGKTAFVRAVLDEHPS